MKLDHCEPAQFRAAEQWWFAEASRSPDLVVVFTYSAAKRGFGSVFAKRILDARCTCQVSNRRAVRRAHVLGGGTQVSQRGCCPRGGSRRER